MFRRKEKKQGRIGLFTADANGYGRLDGTTFEIQFSVEELSQTGKYSQVKVRDVRGLPTRRLERQAMNMVEEFIPTDEIEWLT